MQKNIIILVVKPGTFHPREICMFTAAKENWSLPAQVSVVKESSQTNKVVFLLPKYNRQVEVKVKKQDGAKYEDPPRSSFLSIISPIFYCGNYLSVTKLAAVKELDHSERFLADTWEMTGTGQSYLVFSSIHWEAPPAAHVAELQTISAQWD